MVTERTRVLIVSEQPDVRQVVARVLRWNRFDVVVAASPRDAELSQPCDIAVVDVTGRSEDLDAVTRSVLAAQIAPGILFFDGGSIVAAVQSLRGLLRNVREAVERFRKV